MTDDRKITYITGEDGYTTMYFEPEPVFTLSDGTTIPIRRFIPDPGDEDQTPEPLKPVHNTDAHRKTM